MGNGSAEGRALQFSHSHPNLSTVTSGGGHAPAIHVLGKEARRRSERRRSSAAGSEDGATGAACMPLPPSPPGACHYAPLSPCATVLARLRAGLFTPVPPRQTGLYSSLKGWHWQQCVDELMCLLVMGLMIVCFSDFTRCGDARGLGRHGVWQAGAAAVQCGDSPAVTLRGYLRGLFHPGAAPLHRRRCQRRWDIRRGRMPDRCCGDACSGAAAHQEQHGAVDPAAQDLLLQVCSFPHALLPLDYAQRCFQACSGLSPANGLFVIHLQSGAAAPGLLTTCLYAGVLAHESDLVDGALSLHDIC